VAPTAKGQRVVTGHVGTEIGFIPADLLICKSNQKMEDYQKEMNNDTRMPWVTEKVHPLLPQNRGFVVDKAPYHNVLNECVLPLHQES
jgi:L-serine deaminase